MSLFNLFKSRTETEKAVDKVLSEIANINGLVGDRDLLANHLVTILTIEMQSPAEVMGEARYYGTSFITGQLISSYGINIINTARSLGA